MFHIQHTVPKEISVRCSTDKAKEEILIDQMSWISLGFGISVLPFCELFKIMMFMKAILGLTQYFLKTVEALLSTLVAFQIGSQLSRGQSQLGRNSVPQMSSLLIYLCLCIQKYLNKIKKSVFIDPQENVFYSSHCFFWCIGFTLNLAAARLAH